MSGGMSSSVPREKSSGRRYVPPSLVLGPFLPEASGLRVSVLPLAYLTPPTLYLGLLPQSSMADLEVSAAAVGV